MKRGRLRNFLSGVQQQSCCHSRSKWDLTGLCFLRGSRRHDFDSDSKIVVWSAWRPWSAGWRPATEVANGSILAARARRGPDVAHRCGNCEPFSRSEPKKLSEPCGPRAPRFPTCDGRHEHRQTGDGMRAGVPGLRHAVRPDRPAARQRGVGVPGGAGGTAPRLVGAAGQEAQGGVGLDSAARAGAALLAGVAQRQSSCLISAGTARSTDV